MKPVTQYVAVVLLAALLSACRSNAPRLDKTPVWYQPNKTQAETQRDLAECRMQAAQARAVAPPIYGSGFNYGFQTASQTKALNSIIPLCMEAKGYILIPRYQLPREPVTSSGAYSPNEVERQACLNLLKWLAEHPAGGTMPDGTIVPANKVKDYSTQLYLRFMELNKQHP